MTPAALGLVFLGGGAGATCRYAVGRFVGERYAGTFPLGTCLINSAGCFLLGVTSSVLAGAQHVTLLTALLTTGFLGGFTTFSTYAIEALVLATDGERGTAALSLLVPIGVGLPAAALGALIGEGL